MAIVAQGNTIVATDGTLRPELGRNTQSIACIAQGVGAEVSQYIFLAHDLGFTPTWIQVETCYNPSPAATTGTILPVLIGNPGPPDNDGTYAASAGGITLWYQAAAQPAADPIVYFTVHCGRTHSKAR